MKKTLQTLLFASIAMLMPIGASAHDFEVGGIYYNIASAEDNTVEVTFSGEYYNAVADEYTGEVTILATVTHGGVTYRVTSIGGSAFRRCSGLTSVILPEGVTSIGDDAFFYCTSLASITIPSSVTSIGDDAFYNCTSLASVIILEGVTSIGGYAFQYCTSLASVTIPESVTSIGGYAFSDCTSLTSITIPESVTSIGSGAFYGCSSLTSITIPSSVTSIGSSVFRRCSGLTSVILPEGVTSIETNAFWYCTSLASITIPSSVTSIGEYAFADCTSLTSITLPEGVTSIGKRAFMSCTSLASITIPSSVTSIGDWAFEKCLFLRSNFINNSKCSDATNWDARFYTEEEEVDGMIIRDNVLVAARGNLTIANIPEGVTSLGSYAFYYCTDLASITIPEGVTSIGSGAFSSCTSLTSITIPEGVTSIGSSAFSGCSGLTSITIPEGVTSIGTSAFSSCTSLTSITLPEGVISIGGGAFYGCTSLTDVYYLGLAEQWEAIEIGGYNESLTNATRHYCDANGFCTAHEGHYQPAPLNAEGYYEIANGGQLFWFAQQVNKGGEEARNLKAVLKNDVDLEGRSWTPIGTTGGTNSQSFRGVFDGNGKTITGLNVDNSKSGLGFFGEVRKGVVKDFTIYGDVFLNGKYNYIGGVIGSACGIQDDNGSTISGITSYVNVTLGEGTHGSNHVAGLIGYVNHNTTVERCMWLGELDLDIYRAQDGVGGLIGKANAQYVGTIRDCAAYGTIRTAYQSGSYVNPSDNQPFTNIFIGGIVSNSLAGATTNIENCIWAGNILDYTDLGENAHIAAIGTLNGVGSVSNCYYYLGTVPEVTTHNAYDTNGKVFGVYHSQLVSGEIAAKLGEAWGQNIDGEGAKDAKPVVGGAKLHYGYLSCDENASMAYTNNAEVSEVRPEHNHVDGFCTVCGHIDAEGGIVIRDGQHTAFAIADDIAVASITYTRTLPNQEWNSLYVPFGIEVTEALLQDYEVAYANNMHAYDTDEDGSIDELEMEVIKIKQGTLHANHPYFIRAKSEADQALTLTVENAVLKATKSVSMTCQSFYTQFTLTGIYRAMDEDDFAAIEGTHYAIALEGGWWKTEGLNPFRVYMTITQRDGSPVKVSQEALSRIRIAARGDGSTDIEDVQLTDDNSPLVYDLQGRRVMEPQKGGVYVVNGKKMVW